ncbi:MAG: hypothetical protein ACRDWH_06955, partial [Acidimicrobiia bacterium]
VVTHGRILDRRRLELIVDGADATAVLAALDGYRNADGGYGWGLEPDLRSPESQPAAAMHALEVFAEVAPVTTPRAVELCDWLDASSLADGGLPFALPIADPAGCAPWWAELDTTTSSLQITAAVTAEAHRAAHHHPGVAAHPWLARATRWCLAAIADLGAAPHAYELLFAIRFLDATAEAEPDAAPLLDRLGQFLPADGVVAVQGGVEGEAHRPLDFAPRPGGAARRLFADAIIAEELRRLAQGQRPDGGWTVDFVPASPAATLEWRAYATVRAIALLNAHERRGSG